MILLVSGATRTVAKLESVGVLLSPRSGNSVASIAASGRKWAADNDAYLAWDRERFWRMLAKIAAVDTSRFLWVACPDVVGDAQATVNRWSEWFPQIDYRGLPAAFVAQNGLERIADQIPWHEAAALFVGGSTAWKLSDAARGLCDEAKRRGKWVHIGRVNSRKRMRVAMEFGADSVDGTNWSRWPDTHLSRGAAWLKSEQSQTLMFR